MSVLIKGMEIPKSCAKCKLFGEYGCPFIGAVGYALTRGERNEDCPLVPVPPHGRMIDADALCKTLRSLVEREYTPEVFANWIENHIDSVIPSEEV